MTPETGSLQIISSQAPIAHAALSRLTWGPRSVQLLAGSAIGLIGLGLIPVIGPFSAIIAGIGAAILLHGIFYGESLPLQIPALIKTPETTPPPINPKPLPDASINEDPNNSFWQAALGLGALCYGLIHRNGYSKSANPEGPVVPYRSGESPSLEEGLLQTPYQFSNPNKKPLAIGCMDEESKILAQLSTRQHPIGTITLTDTPRPPGLKPPTHDLTQFPKSGWNPFLLNADPKRNNTDNTSLQIAGKSTPSESPSNRQGIQDILKLIQAAFKNSKTLCIQLFDNDGFCLFDFEGNPLEITIFKQDPQIPNSDSTALAIYVPYRKDRNPEEPFLELIRKLLEQHVRFSIRGDDPLELKMLTYVPAASNPLNTLLDLSNANLKNLIGSRIPNNTPLQITKLPLPNILDTNPTGICSLLPKLPLSSLPTRKISSSISPQLTAALLETTPLTVSKTLLPDQPISNQSSHLAIPLLMLTGFGIDAAISAVKGSIFSNAHFNFNGTKRVLDTSPFSNTTQHLALNGSTFHPTNDNAPLAIPENQENPLLNLVSATCDVTRTALTEYVWPATAFTAQTVFNGAITPIRDYIIPMLTGYASWKYDKVVTRFHNGIRGWSSIISIGATEYLFPALTRYASWKYDKVVTRFHNGIQGWSSIIVEELLPAIAFTARTIFDMGTTATIGTAKYVSWSQQDLKRRTEENRKLKPIADTALKLATEPALQAFKNLVRHTWNDLSWAAAEYLSQRQQDLKRRTAENRKLKPIADTALTLAGASALKAFKDLLHHTWNDLTWLLEMTQWSVEQFHALLKSSESSIKSPIELLDLEDTIISSSEKDKVASPIALYNPPKNQDFLDPNTTSKASADHRKRVLNQNYAILKPKTAPVQHVALQHASNAVSSLITAANLTHLFCPANITHREASAKPAIISEQQVLERFTGLQTKPMSIPPLPAVIYPIETDKNSSYSQTIFGNALDLCPNNSTNQSLVNRISSDISLAPSSPISPSILSNLPNLLPNSPISEMTDNIETMEHDPNPKNTANRFEIPIKTQLFKQCSASLVPFIKHLFKTHNTCSIKPPKPSRKINKAIRKKPKTTNLNPDASAQKIEPPKSPANDDFDIDAFLKEVDATAQKLDDDIKKFEKSKANVETLMNDHSSADSFIKKRAQIEESIKNGKVKTEQLGNELKKIANNPEITKIINETEKNLIENNDKNLSHVIEKFKDIISSHPIENIDALFKEIAIIEENLKRDEARFKESEDAVNKIMNTQNDKPTKTPSNNLSKTIILAALILSISEQIDSVQGNKLVFKSLSQDSDTFIRPRFSFSGHEGSPLPPTA